MDIQEFILNRIREIVLSDEDPAIVNKEIFSTLLKLQIASLQAEVLRSCPSDLFEVQSGPFKGLKLRYSNLEGALLPKFFGCYEQELHPYIRAAASRPYQCLVNVGSADGYYAVGLAKLMPEIEVRAYDIDPHAQERCRQNAALNQVADRLKVFGELKGADFSIFPAGNTLLLCDIEGGEEELLDPVKYPALCTFDLIVEMHEIISPGISQRIIEKFTPTHKIALVKNRPQCIEPPPGLESLSELEKMLLSYEMRAGPTPWAVMSLNNTDKGLLISPEKQVRAGWTEKFASKEKKLKNNLLMDEIANAFDEDEWE